MGVATEQNVVAELTARVNELEAQFEEVKKLKGVRGPAGPIDAAVRNATEAATKATREELARALDSLAGLEERIASRQEAALAAHREHNEHFKDHIEDEIAARILNLLHEYHLLDETNAPTLAADTTAPQNKF